MSLLYPYITLVGFNSTESNKIESALSSAGGFSKFHIRREEAVSGTSFSVRVIHAIVFSLIGLENVTDADVNIIRSATKLGTCRVYLAVETGSASSIGVSLLDDFIQTSSVHGFDALAKQIITFFREADDLNRRNMFPAFRDRICLFALKFLNLLLPVSHLFAGLHFFYLAILFAESESLFSIPIIQYFLPTSTFFGFYFIVHYLYVFVQNGLVQVLINKRINLGLFALNASCYGFAVVAVFYSIVTSEQQNILRIYISAVLSVIVYTFYMHAYRIRSECTSVSFIHSALSDSLRRIDMLNSIGRQSLNSSSFPLFPFRSRSIFISYMRGSQWSSGTAVHIHKWATKDGRDVFIDLSAIPTGGLWRQFLLRGISECGYFVVLIDGNFTASEWVLAESAYAAQLRKKIGKPRILLVVRNVQGIAKDQQNPFHIIYRDMFQGSLAHCYGIRILSVDIEELTAELFWQALEGIQPMSLLL
ncbi:MAG: toll/interleukin-1 receptor domain-containing protein [Chlorobium sp.]